MSAFIDEQGVAWVEPICRALWIAPSTYYAVKRRERAPAPRTLSDREALAEIQRVGSRHRPRGIQRLVFVAGCPS